MPPNFKIELLFENIIVILCISLKVNTSLREVIPLFNISGLIWRWNNMKTVRYFAFRNLDKHISINKYEVVLLFVQVQWVSRYYLITLITKVEEPLRVLFAIWTDYVIEGFEKLFGCCTWYTSIHYDFFLLCVIIQYPCKVYITRNVNG